MKFERMSDGEKRELRKKRKIKFQDDNETMKKWNTFKKKNNDFKCVDGFEFYKNLLEEE